MSKFRWYRIVGDGTAEVIEDSPAAWRQIDGGDREERSRWFGTPEGAIKHGGVQAVAVKRHVEHTFDSAAWLRGEIIPRGEIVVTTITAEPPK